MDVGVGVPGLSCVVMSCVLCRVYVPDPPSVPSVPSVGANLVGL